MARIRLCLVAPVPPPYGGIANWVQLLREYTGKASNLVEMSIVNTTPKSRETEGRSMLNRVLFGGLSMLRNRRELVDLIHNNRPDVIHMTTSGQLSVIRDILLLRLAKKHGIPVAYHLRFGRIPELACGRTIEWWLIKRAICLASVTITIDAKTKSAIRDHLPTVPVVNIINPIDTSSLPSVGTYEAEEKTLLFLGWVTPAKGIGELLAAWASIYSDFPAWRLKLVGPYQGSYVEALKKSLGLHRVEFSGEKSHEEALLLLNSADVLVLPSYTEGCPNVILEAMALSKCIVATSVGAIPELLADKCGVLVNAHDQDGLEEALRAVMLDAKRRGLLGRNASKKLLANYTVDRIFPLYLKVWERIRGVTDWSS